MSRGSLAAPAAPLWILILTVSLCPAAAESDVTVIFAGVIEPTVQPAWSNAAARSNVSSCELWMSSWMLTS